MDRHGPRGDVLVVPGPRQSQDAGRFGRRRVAVDRESQPTQHGVEDRLLGLHVDGLAQQPNDLRAAAGVDDSNTLLRVDVTWRPVTWQQVNRLRVRRVRRSLDRYIGEVLTRSVWLEQRLDANWRAAYRLALQGRGRQARFVIAELGILPTERETKPGEWRGTLLGDRASASVPSGGLSACTMARARSRSVQRAVEAHLRSLGKRYRERAARAVLHEKLPEPASSNRRERRPRFSARSTNDSPRRTPTPSAPRRSGALAG